MKPVFALPTISTDLLCFRLERFYWKFCQVTRLSSSYLRSACRQWGVFLGCVVCCSRVRKRLEIW